MNRVLNNQNEEDFLLLISGRLVTINSKSKKDEYAEVFNTINDNSDSYVSLMRLTANVKIENNETGAKFIFKIGTVHTKSSIRSICDMLTR